MTHHHDVPIENGHGGHGGHGPVVPNTGAIQGLPTGHGHTLHESYFMPGEMLLLAHHDGAVTDGPLRQWALDLCAAYLDDFPDDPPSFSSDAPFVQLDAETGKTALVKVTFETLIEREEVSHEILKQRDETLVSIIKALNDNKENANSQQPAENPILLETVIPNWLASTLPHFFGHPCPGGWPVPVLDGQLPPDTEDLFEKDIVHAAVALHAPATPQIRAAQKGEIAEPQVNVVIFDTVQSMAAIHAASGRYSDHALLRSLVDKQRIHIHHATAHNIPLPPPPLPDESNNPHFSHRNLYKVSDHGLFIAGIVHDFAPEADIHIVEVMNPHGAGTIESLIAGIQSVLNGAILTHPNLPLVVNCSLGFEIPVGDPEAAIELELLRRALHQLEDTFNQNNGARIIAAAGNDGKQSQAPPPACVPAAFRFVIGVGAANHDGARAWYSNIVDAPPNDGLMAFGGDMIVEASGDVKSDSEHGILGIYIGSFPEWDSINRGNIIEGAPSANGWARWSGTSFATGVVSGMFARAAADGRDIKANTANNFYVDLQAQSTDTTVQGEIIVLTPQKP